MSTIDLSQYGITGAKVIHNPSYDQLFIDETNPELQGYEKGQVTELGAVNVMTGIYTGRSPKDKFFVKDDTSANSIWWTTEEYKNDNKPITPATWDALKAIADKELSNKTLYVVDAFCGTNPDTRLAVRFVMEVAWQAHIVKEAHYRDGWPVAGGEPRASVGYAVLRRDHESGTTTPVPEDNEA